ncbi:MAG TPA: HEAT repeat domain-containing protein [Pyrinomonadaceae bacterium]|nr:HEAT repeat domain-containing protein [Pyrinomonadaceae bacterium]
MYRLHILRLLLLLLILFSPSLLLNASAQTSPDAVDKSLAYLRKIDPAKVRTADEEKVTIEIEAAWDTIRKAGADGRTRLKQAITQPGQSDYFKLNGAALLWRIARLEEAETIASIWHSTRLEVHSNYVFYSAFEAAMTQDPKALPMMVEVLGNKKFMVYVVLHAMTVDWPLNMHFIWGVYGPKGLPVLFDVLKKSQDPVVMQSAIFLFAKNPYLEALPRIRELARQGDPDTRRAAIYALGLFGHPDDYDFLISGLKSPDAEDRFFYAMAVYEYEDLRAVPHLIPLLKDRDQKVRREVFANLTHLLTSESVDALLQYAQQSSGSEKSDVDSYLNSEFKEYGLQLPVYLKKSPAEKAAAIQAIRRKREASRFVLKPGEKGFTHEQLVAAAQDWKKNHRMPVQTAKILSGGTANDIELLLEAKAAVLSRLSDECLYEAERIDTAVKRLSRSRYRKDVGITERVEAK